MTKVYKRILIGLASALVLSLGAYGGVSVYKNVQDKNIQLEEDKKNLLSLNENDVEGLKIHNQSGDYEFKLTGNSQWSMVTGSSISASDYTLTAIAATMCDLKADSILKKVPDESSLSKYGLDDPLEITVIMTDSTEHTVRIGDQLKDKDMYYLMVDSDDSVFIVSNDYVQRLMAQKDDLKNKYIFDVSSTDSIDYLRYVKDSEVIYDIKKDSDGQWKMSAPYEWATVNGANVKSLLSELIRASSTTFIEEDPQDLSQYGLDNPSYEIEVSGSGKSASFVFGNYYDDEKQFIYAYDKNTKQVSVFSVAAISCMQSETETVLLNQIHTENLADVTGITFDINGEKGQMDIDYEVDDFMNAVYKINSQTVSTSEQKTQFESLFYAFNGIVFEKIDTDPDENTLKKQPDIRIVHHMKNADDYTLELFETPQDSKYYYAVADGKYLNVLVRKNVIESGIQQTYKQLKDMF